MRAASPKPYRQVITEIVAILEEMAQPLTLRELADLVGVPAAEIRAQVTAFDVELDADRLGLLGIEPEIYIESAVDGWEDQEPTDEDRVKIVGSPMRDLLGIERFDAAVLAPLYHAAAALSELEPDNVELASATEGLLAGFLPGLRPRSGFRRDMLGTLGRAIAEGRQVEIRYSRAWQPAVYTRTIDPYRIVETRRGSEVDAGPLAADGTIRTYIVGRIQSVTLLDSTFTRPADPDERCQAARATSTVSGEVPAGRLWVIERAAEACRVLSRSDDDVVRFEADLLPPVAWRAGRMVVTAGEGARLDQPEAQERARAIAERLWEHHRLGSRPT